MFGESPALKSGLLQTVENGLGRLGIGHIGPSGKPVARWWPRRLCGPGGTAVHRDWSQHAAPTTARLAGASLPASRKRVSASRASFNRTSVPLQLRAYPLFTDAGPTNWPLDRGHAVFSWRPQDHFALNVRECRWNSGRRRRRSSPACGPCRVEHIALLVPGDSRRLKVSLAAGWSARVREFPRTARRR